jgi:tellurite resistance protein TerC
VVAIEAADLVFAVDSVPAVLAVSDNTFIIYASNAFAILGLRALYFLLAGMLKKFHYLGKGLAFILAFIGVKLFLQAGHKVISTSIPEIPSLVSLGVIVVALTVAIVASLMNPLPADEDVDVEVDQASNEGRAIVAGSVVQDGQVDKGDDVRVDPGPDSAASHGLDERTIQPTRG